MTRNITLGLALPLVVALGTSTAVFAQDAASGADTGITATGTPLDWDDPINEAFFDDISSGTLRSDAEISANWANLTPEQQDRVRQHCQIVNADPAGTDDAASATPEPGADGALSTIGSAEAAAAAQAGDAGATGTLTTEQASANLSQLCGLVTGL
ncbi:MAG: hypothetical protein Q7J44_07710 [Pseudotabrizicola sp.]|uniref:hypothetical protein n=1 Tax=Pseudotabrizicola sp. TaxID=2939647 RepID=UPI00272662AA|nr:hypothetical protein [Pseudotabrizicola sp.]MDO9638415.1 hypothetical protein [Pseudotabrizicola sp.]